MRSIDSTTPEDWGISLEDKQATGFIEFSQIKLAPNKPKEATEWRDINGRPVAYNPGTKTWHHTDKKDKKRSSPASRMEQARKSGKWKGPTIQEKTKGSYYSERSKSAASSEKFINSVLNGDLEDSKEHKSLLSPTWEASSIRSINLIKEFINQNNTTLLKSEWVGANKKLNDEHKTADLLLTLQDKKGRLTQVGVNLKKSDSAVFHNKSINIKTLPLQSKLIYDNYIESSNKFLNFISKSSSLSKRADRKNILKSVLHKPILEVFNNDVRLIEEFFPEISSQIELDDLKKLTVEKAIRTKHNSLKKEVLKSQTQDIEEKIKERTKKFVSNIQNGSLITVWGGDDKNKGGIIDKDKISHLNPEKISIEVNSKNPTQKLIVVDGVVFCVLHTREDGIGYGQRFRTDATLAQGAFKNLIKMENKKQNFTESDYLELIKLSRNPEFSDSMVYYRGKFLGRCPSGTIRSGKTCAPGTTNEQATKYKKPSLGGLSPSQVRQLNKAKTTEQVMKARKAQEK